MDLYLIYLFSRNVELRFFGYFFFRDDGYMNETIIGKLFEVFVVVL